MSNARNIRIRKLSFVCIFASLLMAASSLTAAEKEGIFADMTTSKGKIVLELFFAKKPLTVTNFVGLSEGTLKTNKKAGKPFYDGLKFHRVIPNFMVQGGDPEGSGRGGPGYKFIDDINKENPIPHDAPGILSMANAGPNTNGSQFFITHKATSWLNGKHSVFGKVITGMDIVNKIAKDDVLKTVRIRRIGKKAKAFTATQADFERLQAVYKKKNEAAEKVANKEKDAADKNFQASQEKLFKALKKKYPGLKTNPSGLQYVVHKKGNGKTPAIGDKVSVHYTGTLLDGKKFDSSRDRNKPFEFPVGMRRVIAGWDEAFKEMSIGEKRTLIIPYKLAYGERGYPPVIPGKATLVFDVELLNIIAKAKPSKPVVKK